MGEKFSLDMKNYLGMISSDVYESEVKKMGMTKGQGDDLLLLGKYKVMKKLGQGAFGTVYLCNVENSDIKVAIKTIDLQMAKKNNMSIKDILDEVICLKEIDSPYVIKCVEVEQTPENFYIVCEFVDGIELLQLLIKHGAMSEAFAREVFRKILLGISHMHKNNFIHRDLKLENVFVTFRDDVMDLKHIEDIKIVDLGFGQKIWSSVTGFMGTPNYIPPEVFNYQPYDFKFDIFSAGVILYTMICGEFPFNGHNIKELGNAIKNKEPNYTKPAIKKCHPDVVDLLKGLLCKDKSHRLSIDQALNHRWFTNDDVKTILDTDIKEKALQSINEYMATSKVHKAIKIFKTKLSLENNVNKKYKDLFFKYDTDNNGSLSREEFSLFIKELNPGLTDYDVDRMFTMLDLNNDKNLEYKEFISVFDESEEANDEMMINYLFKHIDVDRSGSISGKEVKQFLKENQVRFRNEEMDKIIDQIDINNDGDINIDEFKTAMLHEMNLKEDAYFNKK